MTENQELVHVYMMPGMAANTHIFDYIRLPENYKIHYLTWLMPEGTDETLYHYVQRLLRKVVHPNPVLIGVSFGGIIVQEMSKQITVRKLIVISSIKTKYELPPQMRFAKSTRLYKLLPTGLVKHVDKLNGLPVGKNTQKKTQLYQRYLSINNKEYLDWAIQQVLNWGQDEIIPEIIHIQGSRDAVFPVRYIGHYIEVPEGTHAMIINKYRWFNKHLPSLISSGKR